MGKSFTLLAAFSAATRTEGDGTRSYAKALLRLRYSSYDNQQAANTRDVVMGNNQDIKTYLKLENILDLIKFLLISISIPID